VGWCIRRATAAHAPSLDTSKASTKPTFDTTVAFPVARSRAWSGVRPLTSAVKRIRFPSGAKRKILTHASRPSVTARLVPAERS
jgi:hypothetical protein